MSGKGALKFTAGAVAILAAASAVFFYFLPRYSVPGSEMRQPDDGAAVLSEGIADVAPELPKEDVVLAEIDGVVSSVRIPEGEHSLTSLPEEIGEDVRVKPYDGLDPALQFPDAPFLWYQELRGERIFGRMVAPDGRDVAPVYSCSVAESRCERTEGIASGGGGEAVLVPSGAVSRSGQRVVLVKLADTPYIETGARWELFLYDDGKLAAPKRTFDISAAADRRPDAGYDAVSSVAWSPDERRVAIGTARRISVLDLDSGVLTPVAEMPLPRTEDEPPSWEGDLLVWSPTGRYLVFAAYSDTASAGEEEDEEMPDLLRIIALEEGNELRTVVSASSVQLISTD